MQVIEITVAPDGAVTTKVKGGCGTSCKDATKPIRDALGVTTEDRALPELYAPNPTVGTHVGGKPPGAA